MTIPVLTVATGAPWEPRLVAATEADDRRALRVVRRCVDLADLLAAAVTGIARAVLLPDDLPALDREAVVRLRSAGVGVVAMVTSDDESTQRRLRQIGVAHLAGADAGLEAVAALVVAAVADLARQPAADAALAHVAGHPQDAPSVPLLSSAVGKGGAGQVVAVWGPTGAPGRTTVAVNLAAELAGLGASTLLADADSYGGVVAQVLGLLDEAPGLVAAARAANAGRLDVAGLAGLARRVSPGLRVLTGIPRSDRWPELRASSLDLVWRLARAVATVTVVDCGFSLERDEELSFDTAAPRRNGATLVTLAACDLVVAVGSADPVGVQRLVRGLDDLRQVAPAVEVRVVVNRVREGPVGPRPQHQLAATLDRYAGLSEVIFVPYDLAGLDRSHLTGRTLLEAVPDSPVRPPLRSLAREIAGDRVPGQRNFRSRRRRAKVLRK